MAARRARDLAPSRQPRAHWAVLVLILLVLASGLTLDGYRHRSLGRSGTRTASSAALPGLAAAGPVLDLAGTDVRSSTGPARTVALTFDDGPDPIWTPLILDALARHRVPATFFVVGSRVLAHPAIVRRERQLGDEIGSHTFVHANVSQLPGWQTSLELSLTQASLAATVGIHTALFRPPYSSGTDSVTVKQFRAWRSIAHKGYLIVLSNRDTRDWQRPGVDAILANAQPSSDNGTVILMHDAGGNRSQTVAALDLLIVQLQNEGYRFTTVSGLAGVAPGTVDLPVHGGQLFQGRMVSSAARLGSLTILALRVLAIPVAVLIFARCLLLFALARRHTGIARQTDHPIITPPVTVVVPAFNEEVGIAAAVQSIANSDYPDLEVIVVDDGSTDRTAAIVAQLALPNVGIVRQPNTGKADALNAGVHYARNDLIVTVDGDTVFEPETVKWLVQPFADPRVGAVSGNTKVGNRQGVIGRWQHIEYVMGFNLDRRMYDVLECMPTIPGAIGAFRREVLEQVGGISNDTLAEDTDLTMAIVRAGWRVVYEERARAWTEAPVNLSALWKQRYRWSYGTFQAMWKHRAAVAEGGPLGRRAFPYLLAFQVLLPLLAPVIDLYALFGLIFLNPAPLLAYWLTLNIVSFGLALYAFRLDHESARPLWAFPLQQFVYRQMMYLVVIQSVVTAGLGTRLRWHKLQRTGGLQLPVAD